MSSSNVGIMVFAMSLSSAYKIKCPVTSQWNMTADIYCNNSAKYVCLPNGNNLYTESCYGPDRGPKGQQIVYKGNLDHGNCSANRYQPFTFSTIGYSECAFLKSNCHEEGQIMHTNGGGNEDRVCRCDYTQGYTFLIVPASVCFCVPDVEDCTCLKKLCLPQNMILSPDYYCTLKNETHNWRCPVLKPIRITLKDTNEKVVVDECQGTSKILKWIVLGVLVSFVILVLFILKFARWYSALRRLFEDCSNVINENRYCCPSTKETDVEEEDITVDYFRMSEKIQNGPPEIYKLPLEENTAAQNTKAKTRKYSFGKAGANIVEKTIMFVGSTGCGKTTVIEAMANYLFGVNFRDARRLKFGISDEPSEMRDETVSQTDWITSYTIHSGVSAILDYTINIVDTPGFCDTRGYKQDKKLIEQIRSLFSVEGEQGLQSVDAVCFVTQASTVRMTQTQKYLIESILSLFGRDIKDNFCTVITFADGSTPPVLNALQIRNEFPFLYENYFVFNCCNLFPDMQPSLPGNIGFSYWKMGFENCTALLQYVKTNKTKSLLLSSEVLTKRHELEEKSISLKRLIDGHLSDISTMLKKQKGQIKHKNRHLMNQIDDKQKELKSSLESITKITNRLRKIALRPNISVCDLIDLMIEDETQRKEKGFKERTKTLHNYKEEVNYQSSLLKLNNYSTK